MIERYSLPQMAGIWSEENRFRRMLDVEIAVAATMADAGLIPRSAAAKIKKKAGFDVAEIRRFEKVTRHDVTAFLQSVGKRVGRDARFLHLGLTSSDVLDTGLSLQIRDALDLVLGKARALKDLLRQKSLRYKDAPIMGRTHGVHAEPTTFGLKLLLFYEEVRRGVVRLEAAKDVISYGKISGAVGTNATVSPTVEQNALRRLGLKTAPVSNQVLQRDRHAEVMAALAILGATLEKIATEIRHLQRTEVREVEEGFAEGQTGSSAMPHKRNPVNCERVAGLARVLRGNLAAALENVALWHERDISHSSVERIIFPDSFALADFMLEEMGRILESLRVYPGRMMENIAKSRGLVFSQRLLLALIEKGVPRFDAYKSVQALAMKVWESEVLDLATLARLDRRVRSKLSSEEIDRVFQLDAYLKHIDGIYRRVLKS
jgi:adenylosuccinate lyase